MSHCLYIVLEQLKTIVMMAWWVTVKWLFIWDSLYLCPDKPFWSHRFITPHCFKPFLFKLSSAWLDFNWAFHSHHNEVVRYSHSGLCGAEAGSHLGPVFWLQFREIYQAVSENLSPLDKHFFEEILAEVIQSCVKSNHSVIKRNLAQNNNVVN